jgi:hypothetical protein
MECDGRTLEDSKKSLPPVLTTVTGSMEQMCVYVCARAHFVPLECTWAHFLPLEWNTAIPGTFWLPIILSYGVWRKESEHWVPPKHGYVPTGKKLPGLGKTWEERDRIRHWEAKIDDTLPPSSRLWFIVIIYLPHTSERSRGSTTAGGQAPLNQTDTSSVSSV